MHEFGGRVFQSLAVQRKKEYLFEFPTEGGGDYSIMQVVCR